MKKVASILLAASIILGLVQLFTSSKSARINDPVRIKYAFVPVYDLEPAPLGRFGSRSVDEAVPPDEPELPPEPASRPVNIAINPDDIAPGARLDEFKKFSWQVYIGGKKTTTMRGVTT